MRWTGLLMGIVGCGKGDVCIDDPCAPGQTCLTQEHQVSTESTAACIDTPAECPELEGACIELASASEACTTALQALCDDGFELEIGALACHVDEGSEVNLVSCVEP